MVKNSGFGTRYATLATSMEQELASYDEWIEEARSQLRAIESANTPEVRQIRQRGADMLAALIRARNAIAEAAKQVFESGFRANNVVNIRGHV
ncbi:hypothetical protein [Luteibacter sp.]|uniref:hypothetical protein n=1 Tax=Luteibacter sp. TaxID=1886636 RepID=UPI003F7F76E9